MNIVKADLLTNNYDTHHHDCNATSNVSDNINWWFLFGWMNWNANGNVHGTCTQTKQSQVNENSSNHFKMTILPRQCGWRIATINFIALRFFLFTVDDGNSESQTFSIRGCLLGRSRIACNNHRISIIWNL